MISNKLWPLGRMWARGPAPLCKAGLSARPLQCQRLGSHSPNWPGPTHVGAWPRAATTRARASGACARLKLGAAGGTAMAAHRRQLAHPGAGARWATAQGP
jgi:hypothetical protein